MLKPYAGSLGMLYVALVFAATGCGSGEQPVAKAQEVVDGPKVGRCFTAAGLQPLLHIEQLPRYEEDLDGGNVGSAAAVATSDYSIIEFEPVGADIRHPDYIVVALQRGVRSNPDPQQILDAGLPGEFVLAVDKPTENQVRLVQRCFDQLAGSG